MDVAKWNSVLDRMLQLPLGVRARVPMDSDTADQASLVVSDKAFSRMKMGSEIPRSVQRFFSFTQPHKVWGEDFDKQFSAYDKIWYMRKHDGWFIGIYVNDEGKVKWHTMGGNVFAFIQESMGGFLQKLQSMVDSGELGIRYAFKMEFTIRETLSDKRYRELRNEMNRGASRYVGVIVDSFLDYNPEMDREVVRLSQGRIDGPSWRKGWYESGVTIQSRVDETIRLLGAGGDGLAYHDEKFEVWVAQVKQFSVGDKQTYSRQQSHLVVPYLAKQLCESYNEGFVLHCYKEASAAHEIAQYDIFKLKLEQLGDCGVYYGDSEKRLRVKLTSEEQHAGRQFLVRCLGAECYAMSNLPHHVLVGYFNEGEDKYVVTDRLKLRGVSDIVSRAGTNSRYFHVTQSLGKHPNLTVISRSMANIIACIADSMDPGTLLDRENLKFSSMIPGDSKSSMINLSKAGIVVAGGANLVWESTNGTFHMDAAVVKRMAIVEGKGQPKLSDLVGTGTDFYVLRLKSGVEEWDESKWKEMTDLMKFNQSRILLEQDTGYLEDMLQEQERKYKKPRVSRGVQNSYNGLNVWLFGCFNFNYRGPQQSIQQEYLRGMIDQGVNLLNVSEKVSENGKKILVYEMKMPSGRHDVDIIMVNTTYCSSWRLGRRIFTDKALYDEVKSRLKRPCIIVSDKYAASMRTGVFRNPHAYMVKYDGSDQMTTGMNEFLRERRAERAIGEPAAVVVPPARAGAVARPAIAPPAIAAVTTAVMSKADIVQKLDRLNTKLTAGALRGINVYIHSSASPNDEEKECIDYVKEAVTNYGMNLVRDMGGALVILTGNVEQFKGDVFVHYLFIYEYNVLRFCNKSAIPEGFKHEFNYDKDSWGVELYVFERQGQKFTCAATNCDVDDTETFEEYETNNDMVARAECFQAALNTFCASEDNESTTDDDEEECVIVEQPKEKPVVQKHALEILKTKKFYVQRFSHQKKHVEIEEKVRNTILTHGGTIVDEAVEMDIEAVKAQKWDDLTQYNVCIGFDCIPTAVWDAFLHPSYFPDLDLMVRARDVDPTFLEMPDMRYFVFHNTARGKFATVLPNSTKYLHNAADFDVWMSGTPGLRNQKRAQEILRQPFISSSELKSRTYVWAMESDGSDQAAMQECMAYLRTKNCAIICTNTPHSDSFFPVLFHKWPPPDAFQLARLTLVHHRYILKLRDDALPNLDEVRCHPQDVYSFQWREHFNWWSGTTGKIVTLRMDRPFWRSMVNHNIFIHDEERLQRFFDTPHLHKKDRQHNAKRRQQMMYAPMLRLFPPDSEEDMSGDGAAGDAGGGGAT
jgi:hypothetical protein